MIPPTTQDFEQLTHEVYELKRGVTHLEDALSSAGRCCFNLEKNSKAGRNFECLMDIENIRSDLVAFEKRVKMIQPIYASLDRLEAYFEEKAGVTKK